MFPELKPYLTAFVMPLTSLLLMMLIAALLFHKRPKFARWIIVISVTLLWLFSTNAFSVWLHNKVIPTYPPVSSKYLKDDSVQAVVVLGGGVYLLPGGEYKLSRTSLERLSLGAQLARESGLPLVFSGGAGWGTANQNIAEADVAEKVLLETFGMTLQYKESSSRDTKENASNSWRLLSKIGLKNIAVVTHSTHMPRASSEFKKNGFDVVEASVGQPMLNSEFGLSLLPSASNLEQSQNTLRELIAQCVHWLNNIKTKSTIN